MAASFLLDDVLERLEGNAIGSHQMKRVVL